MLSPKLFVERSGGMIAKTRALDRVRQWPRLAPRRERERESEMRYGVAEKHQTST